MPPEPDLVAQTGFLAHSLYFLFVSFIVAVVTSSIRLGHPVKILSETLRFFFTVVVCIFAFGALVTLLEWLFIRPIL
jgi:hypothetical protein